MKPIFRIPASIEPATWRRCVQSSISGPLRCAGRAAAATSSVPMNAKATPTEHMMRYFQVASSDAADTCVQIRNAVSSVVASMPTHIIPRLLETSTSDIAASDPIHSAPNRRACGA